MYRPEPYNQGDVALLEAKSAAAAVLCGTEQPDLEQMTEGVAGWAITHGIATLWLNSGNLPSQLGDDPKAIARKVAAHLDVHRR